MSSYRLIKEGNTYLFVPPQSGIDGKGPGRKEREGFYNPAMEESRDISVIVAQTLVREMQDKEIRVLDGLSSVGARGLRIANEVKGKLHVVLNDLNEKALHLAEKSIERNNLSNVSIRCDDLNATLSREGFHYIDIDPFGTPVPYIGMAVRRVLPKGILAVTATDTATLCGVYRKTCIRRYNAIPLRTWYMHEVGLRILLGYIIREGARFDRALYPLLSYSRRYYMRVYLRVERGARKADEVMKDIGMLRAYDFNFRRRMVGPLWKGELHDARFLASLREEARKRDFRNKRILIKLLDRCAEEVGMPPFFYDLNILSSHFNRSPPKLNKLMGFLRKEGYRVSRTHFRDTSFKCDAPLDKVLEAFDVLTI